MTASNTIKRRISVHDILWLCFAIVVHASLLLIPVNRESALQPGDPLISVSLMVDKNAQAATTKIEPDPVELPQELTEQSPPEQPVPAIPEKLTERPEPQIVETARPTLPASAALIWVSFSQPDWLLAPESHPMQLGVYHAPGLPENWQSGPVLEDNLFNGMVIPQKTELVDRWLAANGSRNVVTNTSAGQTLCGRGLAWDPMHPLVENVMQFRPCAGGGKRTFEMTKRQPRQREFSELVNSTTK